jgi:hypothetical protein
MRLDVSIATLDAQRAALLPYVAALLPYVAALAAEVARLHPWMAVLDAECATLLALRARGAAEFMRQTAMLDVHLAALELQSPCTARSGATATSIVTGAARFDANSVLFDNLRSAAPTPAAEGGTLLSVEADTVCTRFA